MEVNTRKGKEGHLFALFSCGNQITIYTKVILGDGDVILLGPRVGYRLEKVKEICPNTKVEVIDMMDYGMMNGEKVLNHVKEMLGE